MATLNSYRVTRIAATTIADPGSLGGAVAVTQADDSFTYVPFGGPSFALYGTAWPGAWVNTNGSLTFGAGDSDYTESVPEFLASPPRVGALWDDLHPGNAPPGFGLFANVLADRFVATWANVPEYPAAGFNTLQVTLDFATGAVTLNFDVVDSNDSIVGISPGLGADGVEVDLSAVAGGCCGSLYAPKAAVFEQFLGGGDPFDLTGTTLVFTPCGVDVPARGDDQVKVSGAAIDKIMEARENADECGSSTSNGRNNDNGVTDQDYINMPPGGPPGMPVGPNMPGGLFPS